MSKIKNAEVAKILHEIADLLEIQEVQFKPAAYRRAAQNIEMLSENVEDIYKQDKLKEIPGVGEGISSKIQEYLKTGTLKYLEDLKKEIPEGLNELIKIEGIGPKTAIKLHKELGIKTVNDLELAINTGKFKELRGFGEKKVESFVRGIELYKSAQGRHLLGNILPVAEEIESQLRKSNLITKISIAGSIRRKNETVGDIDILIVSAHPLMVVNYFTQLPIVDKVLSEGETKSSVILNNKVQVDLRIVEESSFGSALQYFTGSKEHNIKLRELAKKRNLKLSEYGLFNQQNDSKLAGDNEEEIYKLLGLNYIEPELRENRGEIELASKGQLPKLVQYSDIKGDFHMHTTWSDGADSIEAMGTVSKQLGYKYIAICDHSNALKVAKGISERDIRTQINEIQKLNDKLEDFFILSGIELNIDSNGKLDIRNEVLKDLNIVIASIHTGFKQEEKKINNRIITAMHNDYVNVIGHPTGRIINERASYKVNLTQIFEKASDLGTFLEINAYPDRLDLSDINCFKAKKFNLKFTIGTDAHSVSELNFLKYGVATARRGWLEKNEIINTMNLNELKGFINV